MNLSALYNAKRSLCFFHLNVQRINAGIVILTNCPIGCFYKAANLFDNVIWRFLSGTNFANRNILDPNLYIFGHVIKI